MTDEIPGVPEGWKIKRIGIDEDSEYYIHSDGSVREVPNIVLGNLSNASDCAVVVERDIKIIDMSKCKVDIEFYSDVNNCWIAGDYEQVLSTLRAYKIRVRQNHYFRLLNLEKPIPDGLEVYVEKLELKERGYVLERKLKNSQDVIWTDKEIIGFKVVGEAENYAYKHEIEGN